MRPHLPSTPSSQPSPPPRVDVPAPVLAEGTSPAAPRYEEPRSHTLPIVMAVLGVIAIAATTYTALDRRAERRATEARYPIVAAVDAGRWGGNNLLRALSTFDAPALGELKGVGACTLTTSLRRVVLPGDKLPVRDIATEIDGLVTAATRGRFATTDELAVTKRALSGAFLVAMIDEQKLPELDRAHDTILPGAVSGTAYVLDPATGELRCAGAFHAMSPDAGSLSQYAGLDAANAEAQREFAAETDRAIAASLRAID